MPPKAAPGGTRALEVSAQERNRRIEAIENDRAFISRVGEALSRRFVDREASPHLEKQIYHGFPGRNDQALMEGFHEERWSSRISLIEKMQDSRLVEFAYRLVYFERPEALSGRFRQDMDLWLADRVLTEDASVPWVTIPKALRELEEQLAMGDKTKSDFLREIKEFLLSRTQHLSGS